MTDAPAQQKYQVRFDWGRAGFEAQAPAADVVIVVDALPAVDASAWIPTSLSGHRAIAAGLHNRRAVAEWVLERQAEKGDRFAVVVIAVGERRGDGSQRVAVEDALAAGAVIDALSTLGIDHCSPEAAAASAAFVGLGRALRHLVSASETGVELSARGEQAAVHAAGVLDNSAEVIELAQVTFPA